MGGRLSDQPHCDKRCAAGDMCRPGDCRMDDDYSLWLLRLPIERPTSQPIKSPDAMIR